ncbi:16 kDa calcium-binding protein-like [Tubulanus polymorphus]|uniref:16 kDa calcium-binding protein-like n=1 Tax=Tubulanus polymorphus TaxID=672921 RepID=UPI003DA5A543
MAGKIFEQVFDEYQLDKTQEELRRHIEFFYTMDEDCSEYLSKKELMEFIPTATVEKSFPKDDKDGDDKISLKEFLQTYFEPLIEEKWKDVYSKEFDDGENMKLKPAELETFFAIVGLAGPRSDKAKTFFEKHDLNKDGVLDVNEFVKYLKYDLSDLLDELIAQFKLQLGD